MKTIAKKRLDYESGGRRANAWVRLFAPRREGDAWRCAYRMTWPGHERTYAAIGEDQWQAVQLAMRVVPSALFATEDFKLGRIGVWGKTQLSYEDLCDVFGVPTVAGPAS